MSQLKLCPIRSSSKGNASIIFSSGTKILVDCGISGKTLEDSLASLDLSCSDFGAIVITHEHSDHIKGVGVISRKYNLPIFANAPTWQAMEDCIGKISPENKKVIEVGHEFYINDIKVNTFPTSHDAASPVGYIFELNSEKVALATDMGEITKDVVKALSGSHTALIEANYDEALLDIGSYPYELKKRIKGPFGHLCNQDSGVLARVLMQTGTKKIILGHLSEENNYPLLAFKSVEEILSSSSPLEDDFKLFVMTREGKLISDFIPKC